MEGTLYQLLDRDGEQVGLIHADLSKIHSPAIKDNIEKDWQEFYNSFETDADDFADWMNQRYPNAKFERVFVEELNPLL